MSELRSEGTRPRRVYEKTGFTSDRSWRHDNVLIPEWLQLGRKFGAKEIPVDTTPLEVARSMGRRVYAPDIVFCCPDEVYVDIKDPQKPNLAIAADEFEEQEANWQPMVYAWKEGDRWCYANHQLLRERMIPDRMGRQRRPGNENGSGMDWYLFRRDL
jgi:hypothetical protein